MIPALKKLNPAVVKTARGQGLMCAIEIKPTNGKTIIKHQHVTLGDQVEICISLVFLSGRSETVKSPVLNLIIVASFQFLTLRVIVFFLAILAVHNAPIVQQVFYNCQSCRPCSP